MFREILKWLFRDHPCKEGGGGVRKEGGEGGVRNEGEGKSGEV